MFVLRILWPVPDHDGPTLVSRTFDDQRCCEAALFAFYGDYRIADCKPQKMVMTQQYITELHRPIGNAPGPAGQSNPRR
jgi:hypothetical protein